MAAKQRRFVMHLLDWKGTYCAVLHACRLHRGAEPHFIAYQFRYHIHASSGGDTGISAGGFAGLFSPLPTSPPLTPCSKRVRLSQRGTWAGPWERWVTSRRHTNKIECSLAPPTGMVTGQLLRSTGNHHTNQPPRPSLLLPNCCQSRRKCRQLPTNGAPSILPAPRGGL